MTRSKKTETQESNIETTQDKKQEKLNEVYNLFTPENMTKMFEMFEQFTEIKKQKEKQENKIKQEDVIKATQEENKKEVYEKFTKSKLMKIKNEEITIRSVVENVSFTSPITKITYRWKIKGTVQAMTIGEVLTMDNVSSRFLFTPWLVIEDDRVIEALGLGRIYELIEQVEDISQLVKFSKEKLEDIFNELPKNYQNSFKNEIFRKVRTRELNDLKTIDNLSEILHIDFSDI